MVFLLMIGFQPPLTTDRCSGEHKGRAPTHTTGEHGGIAPTMAFHLRSYVSICELPFGRVDGRGH